MKDIAKAILFILLVYIIILEITGGLHLKDSTLVIAFFGILATFVVISNYSQVKDIKQETHEEIKEFKQEISEKINDLHKKVLDDNNKLSIQSQHKQIIADFYDERGNSKLTPIANLVNKHQNDNAQVINLLKAQKKKNESLKLLLSSLLHSETRNFIFLIESVYETGNYKCKVKCNNREEAIDAIVKWSDEEGIFFEDNNQLRINNVSRVSNKRINKQEVDNVLRGLKFLLK